MTNRTISIDAETFRLVSQFQASARCASADEAVLALIIRGAINYSEGRSFPEICFPSGLASKKEAGE